MITAVLLDTIDGKETFPAFMLKERLGDCVPIKTVSYYSIDADGILQMPLYQHVQNSTKAKCFSFGWMDLGNPGQEDAFADYGHSVSVQPGESYDYTFYMTPTVYTVTPGHHLKLILTTWDPYRIFSDDLENDNFQSEEAKDVLLESGDSVIPPEVYSFTVEDASVYAELPFK